MAFLKSLAKSIIVGTLSALAIYFGFMLKATTFASVPLAPLNLIYPLWTPLVVFGIIAVVMTIIFLIADAALFPLMKLSGDGNEGWTVIRGETEDNSENLGALGYEETPLNAIGYDDASTKLGQDILPFGEKVILPAL